MSNETYNQITQKKKITAAQSASTDNASQTELFNKPSPKKTTAKSSGADKKKPTAKKKKTKQKKKKKTAPKRNPTLHKFFGFLEKNFTPVTITVIALLIIISVFLIGAICGFRLHKSLQKQSRANTVDAYIESASKESDVPYDVIYAIIEAESSFDPDAVSPTGARGLMQINEITLKEINRQLNTNYSLDDLFDPEINVKLGTHYLSYLYKRFDNVDTTVYAAYNAGPTRVETEWLPNPEYSSDGKTLILENIPYEETRRYVQKVSAFRENYLAKQG